MIQYEIMVRLRHTVAVRTTPHNASVREGSRGYPNVSAVEARAQQQLPGTTGVVPTVPTISIVVSIGTVRPTTKIRELRYRQQHLNVLKNSSGSPAKTRARR